VRTRCEFVSAWVCVFYLSLVQSSDVLEHDLVLCITLYERKRERESVGVLVCECVRACVCCVCCSGERSLVRLPKESGD